jgi:hypothetical protein
MRYIEALEVYEPTPDELAVFLGGGITGCPDWQAEIVAKLSDVESLTLLNPRRANFPINDPSASEAQIKWEFEHLRKADAILFWFPKETLCPITLFELGAWLMSGKQLFVGVHPDYARRQDIEVQTKLAKAGRLKIFYSLDDLATQVRLYL